MRFYQDDCSRLVRVRWFFVERKDFVPAGPFVSSYFDEEPGQDGSPVGEMHDGRVYRTGSIPPGAVIAPVVKGTQDQWAGNITLADRVTPGGGCGCKVTACRVSSAATLTAPNNPCAAVAPFAWNGRNAPVAYVNGEPLAWTLGPLVVNGQDVPSPGGLPYWYAPLPASVVSASCPMMFGSPSVYLLWSQAASTAGVPPGCTVGTLQTVTLQNANVAPPPGPSFAIGLELLYQLAGWPGSSYSAGSNTWTIPVAQCVVNSFERDGELTTFTFSQAQD